MAAPGTVTIKVVLDTAEAEAYIDAVQKETADLLAALHKEAVDLREGLRRSRGGFIPAPRPISKYIVDIVGKLSGCRISPTDSEYLISCIKSRTY